MAASNGLFSHGKRKREEYKTFAIEIDVKKNNWDKNIPKLTLALYETKFLFTEFLEQQKALQFEFKIFSESDQGKDKRKIEVTIQPNKDNFSAVDGAFRQVVKKAHEYGVIYLGDKGQIDRQYEDYLERNELVEKKKHQHHTYQSTRPGGSAAY